MSHFDISPSIDLEISASPGTEVFLLDAGMNVQASGSGGLSAAVDPGLYKIRYRAGNATVDEYAELADTVERTQLTAPTVTFSSPAPLADTTHTREHHEDAAARLSGSPGVSVGTGAQIFVFARSLATEPSHARTPARGVQLCSMDGSLLVDVETHAVAEIRSPEPWAGLTIDVDPGSYRLRFNQTTWGDLEQVIVASPGWQTQVFVLATQTDPTTMSSLPSPEDGDLDVVGSAIMHTRIGDAFDPNADSARQTELARIGLANGRVVFPLETLTEAVDNPTLGLLGAHALLRAGAPGNTLADVVARLRQELGDHPDVKALTIATSMERSALEPTFAAPPMLAASWAVVVAASTSHPALVPRASLSAQISPAVWGNGPWLVWLRDIVDGDLALDHALVDGILDAVASSAEELLGALREQNDPALSAYEDAIRPWLTEVAALQPPSDVMADAGRDQWVDTMRAAERLVESASAALGLPPATVELIAASLQSKLAEPGAIDAGEVDIG